PARLIVLDDTVDLAILKITVPYSLPTVRVDDADTLHHGEKLSIVGYDPIADIADSSIWTPSGYRELRMPYPSVLETSLSNAGYDDRSENAVALDALLTNPNRAVRPGFSGAMVCNSDGRAVGVHNSGMNFGGYGGEIGGKMLGELIERAAVKITRSPFWRMPLKRESPERMRGRATFGLASFLARFADDAELSPDDIKAWRTFLARFGDALTNIPEYHAVKATLDFHEGLKSEAEWGAFEALNNGLMRFSRHILTVLARENPERALPYADRLADIRTSIEGAARYGSVSYTRSMLSITESELRVIGDDLENAEALLLATMPDHEANGSMGPASFRLGKIFLAQDKYEDAVEAFQKGVGDRELYDEDWSPLVEACSLSVKEKDQAYGVRFSVWAFSHGATVKNMPPFAADCAEKRGEPELAAWFASLGRALNPPQERVEESLPVNSEIPPAPTGDHYAQSRYRRTAKRR
ncbi:serine protease, partial [bacterium]